MKFVITNDDGYGEPGIEALLDAARSLGSAVVVAPREPHSFISHRVTVREPLQVERPAEDRYIVYGSPADCTRLALKSLVPDADWVLAGINPGANLGNDVYQSGTVAAAREAAILGPRGLALSHKVAPGEFWNVNLPSPLPPEGDLAWQLCPRDRHAHTYRFVEKGREYHYEGTIHDRPRSPGSDVDVCFGGNVSVTRMEI